MLYTSDYTRIDPPRPSFAEQSHFTTFLPLRTPENRLFPAKWQISQKISHFFQKARSISIRPAE